MQEVDVNRTMILVAVVTVVVGLLILFIGKTAAEQAQEPVSPRMRRNAIILTLSGPVSLVLWYLLNGMLEGVGYRSIIGYVLAAVVFVGGGFITGLFSRVWRHRAERTQGGRPGENER